MSDAGTGSAAAAPAAAAQVTDVAAPAAAGAAGELAPPAAPAEKPWYEGSSPETAAYLKAQKFDGLDALARSQQNLVKLKGAPDSELLRLPQKWDENPEEAAKVYARMGRPEKPEQYEIPSIPVGEGDRDLAPEFKAWAHEAGLSGKQATALATKYQGVLQAAVAARAEAISTAIAAENQALKSEWGGEYQNNVEAGRRALAVLGDAVGLTTDDLVVMEQSGVGHAKVMKLMALIGRTIGEHETVGSDAPSKDIFGMTPDAAREKARTLLAERMAMPRNDPRREWISREITRLQHISTGESIPEHLRQ